MEQKETTFPKYNKSFFTNAIEASIIALVILVPIAFYPRCITVFLPAKEVVSSVLVLLALMFWFLKMISREEIKFISKPLNFPLLSFMAICLLSLIWSNSFFVSLIELPLFLSGPLLYFVIINNINDERQINRILDILLLIGALFGIYGILQYNGIDFSFWTHNTGRSKVFGLFGNVNYFAEYLIIPLPIVVSLFFVTQNKLKKILLLIGIIVMGASLMATFTRGSYLGFGVSLIFMFFLFQISRGKKFIKNNKNIFIIILLAIFTIIFLFVVPTPLSKSGTAIEKIKSRISISQLTQSSSIKRRIATWKFTGMMIKDHPILGSGIGTFKYNDLRYQAKFFAQGENRSLYPYGFAGKAHNEYLQLWAELGIIGLGIFAWLIISYFSCGLKILRKLKDEYKQGIIIGLMGAVVAVLVDGIFGFPLHLPATVILFWLSIGFTIIMGGNKPVQNKDKKSETRKTIFFPFKLFLYLGIIFLSVFLCVTIARPFIARIHWYSADREIKNEDWNEKIKMYGKALKWDPYLGSTYYSIGKILLNNDFYIPAMEYYEKAEKYIDFPDLPLDLAIIYLKKDFLDKAAIKLKQAISYKSDEKSMVPLYSELGNTYLRLKRYKPAEIAFKNALKINPNFVNAQYGLAGAYLQQNKKVEALEEFEKVIEIAPDSPEAKHARNIVQQIEQEKLQAPLKETDKP
jgi:O-antigen ligase/Tfp pilus assembly protein PilF